MVWLHIAATGDLQSLGYPPWVGSCTAHVHVAAHDPGLHLVAPVRALMKGDLLHQRGDVFWHCTNEWNMRACSVQLKWPASA